MTVCQSITYEAPEFVCLPNMESFIASCSPKRDDEGKPLMVEKTARICAKNAHDLHRIVKGHYSSKRVRRVSSPKKTTSALDMIDGWLNSALIRLGW